MLHVVCIEFLGGLGIGNRGQALETDGVIRPIPVQSVGEKRNLKISGHGILFWETASTVEPFKGFDAQHRLLYLP